MVRVKVKNFQSITDACIEIKGFTVITGINNSGKSALTRAIRGAFQNAKGSSFVRYGCPTTEVAVEFDDGHSFSWEKGRDTKPTYIIDNGKPIHPGQGIPDEVRELGVASFEAGGKEVWPQFAPQFDGQVFLLNQPGSVLAEAVADVERVGQLNEALRSVESDRRAAAAEAKIRRADIQRHEQRLAKFKGLDDLAREVEEIEAHREKVETLGRAIAGLTVLRGQRDAAAATIAHLEGIGTVEIPQDEPFEQARKMLKEQEDLVRLRDRRMSAQARIAKLNGLEQVRFELDSSQAEKFLAALEMVGGLRSRRQAAESQIRRMETELAEAEKELAEATESIQELLGGYLECPLCGSALDHLHGEGT